MHSRLLPHSIAPLIRVPHSSRLCLMRWAGIREADRSPFPAGAAPGHPQTEGLAFRRAEKSSRRRRLRSAEGHSSSPGLRRKLQPLAFLTLLAALLTPPLRAQGCPQCQDNLRQTPPRTQSAYRHAILLMTLTGTTLFASGIVLLRRFR